MKPSDVILACVSVVTVLGLNGLVWFAVIDEWTHRRKISASIGATLIILFDLLLVALILDLRGM